MTFHRKGKGRCSGYGIQIIYEEIYSLCFSRRNRLPEGFSTRDMAADQAEAMKLLGISRADVMGVSQGGMIAQYLATDYPDMVNKLVLAVTLARQNETIREAVGAWIDMLKYPILTREGKPESFDFRNRR